MQIVEQAVARGHQVTALVRSPDPLRHFASRIHIHQGNLLDPDKLANVIQGQDAVVSGFGPRYPLAKGDEHLLEQFALALTTAMQRAGVKRVVVESVAFLFKDSIFPPVYLLGRLFFSRTLADASAMESVFAKSGLDWTIVRPPELTSKARTGKYRVRIGHLPTFGLTISRADVADLMLKLVEDSSSVHQIVGVSN
jgi:putative NADH-flavin reductase